MHESCVFVYSGPLGVIFTRFKVLGLPRFGILLNSRSPLTSLAAIPCNFPFCVSAVLLIEQATPLRAGHNIIVFCV